MKIKALLALIVIIASMAGCGSSPKTTVPDDLDLTLREVSNYLNERIPIGRKIAVISIQSDSSALSEYIIDELISNAVNDNTFSVVDRQQLDVARAELDLNLSGEVNDNSAQAVGKFLGVQVIITGRVSRIGDIYRISIRALEVETVQVQGSNNWNISAGKTITALMNTKSGNGTTTATASRPTNTNSGQSAQVTSVTTPVTPPSPAYKIGDTGPAGGIIFYDKGNDSGGWRYLEAAPQNTERTAIYHTIGMYDSTFVGSRRIGDGKENTNKFIIDFQRNGGGINTAPWLCNELNVNGFNDWYLPSADELLLMYNNLYMNGLGGLRNSVYWSSTIRKGTYTQIICIDFVDGSEKQLYTEQRTATTRNQVRAIRQF